MKLTSHAPAVVNGTIQFLSVSQLQDAAACERSWYLGKVVRVPRPTSKAQATGSQLDEQWAHYLSTGEDVLGDLARLAKDLLPPPGPDLLVKYRFDDLLTAGGIPVIGEFDIVNPRRLETEGIVRVTDNKTSADPAKYAPAPEQLKTIDLDAIRRDERGASAGLQMVGYAVAVSELYPTASVIELEHIYTPTRAPKKRAKAFPLHTWTTPDDARAQWSAAIEPLVERMKVVALASGLDDVKPNWNACERYGGCPYKLICLTHKRGETAVSLRDRLKQQSTSAAAAPAPASNVNPLVQGNRYTLPDDTIGTFAATVDVSGVSFASFSVEGQAAPKLFDAELAKSFAPVVEPVQTIVPPDAPPSDPKLASEQPAPEPEKKTRARKAKSVEQPTPEQVADAIETVKAEGAGSLLIFVDALPRLSGRDVKSLAPYVDGLVEQIRAKFDVLDVRCAPNADHPLAFGKWKGILAAMVRETPPAPGIYVAIGVERNDALAEAVNVLDAHVVARGVR